jgi:hypothetical protein
MTAPLYSLEESLERAVVEVLAEDETLADCRIVPADRSDEDALPVITVRAEKLEEVVTGMQTWLVRLAVTLTTAADKTPAEEEDERRLPDLEDDDKGVEGFQILWQALWAALDGADFLDEVNDTEVVKVWGLEFDPTNYDNADRAFRRTVSMRVWCNEVAAPAIP